MWSWQNDKPLYGRNRIEGSFASAETPSIFGVCNKRCRNVEHCRFALLFQGRTQSIFAIVYALYATISYFLKTGWKLISLCSIIPMGITSLACVSSSTYSQLCQNMWYTIHGWSRLASEKEPQSTLLGLGAVDINEQSLFKTLSRK